MNLRDIYASRRIWKTALVAVSIILVVAFIYISNQLARNIALQERDRMEIWANATKELASAESNVDVDFLLSIIEGNHNIPVLLVDQQGDIMLHRNFPLPEPIDSLDLSNISPANRAFLQRKLDKLRNSSNKIEIQLDDQTMQYLYYEDSTVLRQLAWFPYIQLAVMLIVLGIAYFALISVKKAEQNKVWVGLSKETAHQLGTPISSLSGWTQVLGEMDVDASIVADMDKDVKRLSVIADRFSKIGSMPDKEPAAINSVLTESLEYMRRRIPKRVQLTIETHRDANIMVCQSLFEWVMENLTKNAVDAMDGEGRLTITADSNDRMATILVSDTGKGIARKNFKNVFNPGFTTKKRGWGLGLTLVKRIIEEYHDGHIYVKDSEPGVGTTFAIELPVSSEQL